MDWRKRKYYTVSFDWTSQDMRLEFLKSLTSGKMKVRTYQDVPKQTDEMKERGHYQFMISIPAEDAEAVEYELRKAERNDDWCDWKEIVRKVPIKNQKSKIKL